MIDNRPIIGMDYYRGLLSGKRCNPGFVKACKAEAKSQGYEQTLGASQLRHDLQVQSIVKWFTYYNRGQ